MKALTLWPEWAWAVVNLDKRVENRTRPIPPSMVGQLVALHAGKHIGGRPGVAAKIEGIESVNRTASVAGWFAHGTARSCEFVRVADALTVQWNIDDVPTSSIVALVRFGPSFPPLEGNLMGWRDPEQHGWPITEVLRLKEPVTCNGPLGFWDVPSDVLQRCRDQVPG